MITDNQALHIYFVTVQGINTNKCCCVASTPPGARVTCEPRPGSVSVGAALKFNFKRSLRRILCDPSCIIAPLKWRSAAASPRYAMAGCIGYR